jgi:hypothetical protein
MSSAHRPPARWTLPIIALLTTLTPITAGPIRPGFDAAALPAADDVSSGPVALGFSVNFFGQTFASIHVNENGNLTFGAPLTDFTPVPLGQLRAAIVAPFFADVDSTAAGRITYGTGTVDGRAAFAATWSGVGYYDGHSDRVNDFQAVLIDRSDTGAGNFDVEFNYGRMQWESGDFSGGVGGRGGSSARVGYSGGTREPGTFYELLGSGVPGAFLDDGPSQTALALAMLNSDIPGRYILLSRDGTIAGGGALPPPPSAPSTGGGFGETGPVAQPIETGNGNIGGGVIGTPEPGSFLLGLVGTAGVVLMRLRRKRDPQQLA